MKLVLFLVRYWRYCVGDAGSINTSAACYVSLAFKHYVLLTPIIESKSRQHCFYF